jgi:uncharacterized protein YndB with AHSA1/START domain
MECNDGQLVFDFELEAPPEKVWRALTIPAFRDRWLGPLDSAGTGFAGSIEAEPAEAEPPSRLSWHWREAGEPAGLVSFILTPNENGGTLLRLVHVRRQAALPAAANGNFGPVALAA